MTFYSPFERVQELIGLLTQSPDVRQIVRFLSGNLDPMGVDSGVSWAFIDQLGRFRYEYAHGVDQNSRRQHEIPKSDYGILAQSLRSSRVLLFDASAFHQNVPYLVGEGDHGAYAARLIIPIAPTVALDCILNSHRERLEHFIDYFECMGMVLGLWKSQREFREGAIANLKRPTKKELTPRQHKILEMILAGATNQSIGMNLGYSSSLIRQETIIIYRKLGVNGRRELLADLGK